MGGSGLTWAIITGEYPPQQGGVGDYTRLLACGLAGAGDEVHVWAPDGPQPAPEDPGVRVHRLPGHFGPRALRRLGGELKEVDGPARILVQYLPHAYGWKAMNLPFCLWLSGRRRPVWIMFHEVAFPWGSSLKHNLLAAVNRAMAWCCLRAAERVFISIPKWADMLRPLMPGRREPVWLPLSSNLPTRADPERTAAVRRRYASTSGAVLIGHFGTFGSLVASLVAEALPPLLLVHPDRAALFIGSGGEELASDLSARVPALAGRVHATGHLPSGEASAHLAACDVLVQPYPDGVSSRRTSVLAGLALGLPVVTNEGPLSESIWAETGAVALARSLGELPHVAERVVQDAGLRSRLAARATQVYGERFALPIAVRTLRGCVAGAGGA